MPTHTQIEADGLAELADAFVAHGRDVIGTVTIHSVTTATLADRQRFFDDDAFAGNSEWASAIDLDPGAIGRVRKSVSLAQHTTRTHYPGRHRVEALVNGAPMGSAWFTVT